MENYCFGGKIPEGLDLDKEQSRLETFLENSDTDSKLVTYYLTKIDPVLNMPQPRDFTIVVRADSLDEAQDYLLKMGVTSHLNDLEYSPHDDDPIP